MKYLRQFVSNTPCGENWLKGGNMLVWALSEYSEAQGKWSALLLHL